MEQVVLVDDNNHEIGIADKATIHTSNTPLHRAFSLFVFNAKNELLVTRRPATKKTFPGLWTNSVCGHVSPQETTLQAAARRLKEELGMITSEIKEVSPYRYCFTDKNGIMENEICPILITYCYAYPRPNHAEVEEWKWMPWKAFLLESTTNSAVYSPWCIEEAKIIDRLGVLRKIKASG